MVNRHTKAGTPTVSHHGKTNSDVSSRARTCRSTSDRPTASPGKEASQLNSSPSALPAAYPARRAARVEPITALRHE